MKITYALLALLLAAPASGLTMTRSFANSLSVEDAFAQDDSRSGGLDELYKKLIAAYELKDLHAVALLYKDNAYILPPDREVLHGHKAIVADLSRYFEIVNRRNKKLSLTIEILDRQISGNVAIDIGTYTIAEIRSDGDELKTRGKFVAVAEQQPNGEWRFKARSDSYVAPPRSNASSLGNVLYGPSFDAIAFEKEIDRIFAEQMTKLSIPGAAIAIVKNGEIVLTKGYGVADLEKKNPVIADKTIFRIGSITKVFTTTAVMQMADAGKLRLDDDVNKHLVETKVPATYPTPITVANLLTHSSGLDEITPGRRTSDRTKLVPLGEFLKTRLVRRLPANEVISYSTYNSALAGHIVERLSGKSLHDHFRTNIFEPLGMSRSSLADVPNELAKDFATGYEVEDGKTTRLPFQWFITYPASDINSTTTDMAKFMITLLNKGTYKDTRILSRSSTEAMDRKQFSGHPEISGYTYGLQEWQRRGVRFIEHGGSMDDGYSALLSMIPDENFGFFVACNTENGGFGLGTAVKAMLLDNYFPVKSKTLDVIRVFQSSSDLQRFAGKYQNDIYCHSCPPGSGIFRPQPFEVKVNGQILEFWGATWRQVSPLVFELASGPRAGQIRVAFRENSKGAITYMFQDWSTFERVP